MSRHVLRPVRLVLPAVLAAATLVACGGPLARSAAPEEQAAAASAPPLADSAVPLAAVADAAPASGSAIVARPRGGDAPAPDGSVPGALPMLIRTGSATIRVDSLEPALAAITRTAGTLGGVVGNTSIVGGEDHVRRATIELRVPAARFDEALAGLRPLGEVESVTTSAEDVGEEFVDVGARVANAKRLEERLVQLLATRTGKLDDVLAVERELARVREEIERHEGRLRFLRTRAATSTLTLSLHEPVPLVGETPGGSVIGEAFVAAWRSFVRTIAVLIESLGVVVPVGVVGALGALGVRRWRRRAVAGV